MYFDQEGGGGLHPAHVPPHRMVFDGKRMRKPIQRKTVDFNSPVILMLQVLLLALQNLIKFFYQSRKYQRGPYDRPALQPSSEFVKDVGGILF